MEKLSDLPKDALLKQVEAQVRQMKANNDDADLLEALLEYWVSFFGCDGNSSIMYIKQKRHKLTLPQCNH